MIELTSDLDVSPMRSESYLRKIIVEVGLVEVLSYKFHEFWDMYSLMRVDDSLHSRFSVQRGLYRDSLYTLDAEEISKQAYALRRLLREAIAVMEERVRVNLEGAA